MEQLPTPEHNPDEDRRIAEGVRYSEEHDTLIHDSTARLIALQWHSGQDSALYSLGSCGAIDRDRTKDEIKSLIAYVEPKDQFNMDALSSLYLYVHDKENRGPQDGWHQLTADDAPALASLPEIHSEQFVGNYKTRDHYAYDRLAVSGLTNVLEQLRQQTDPRLSRYVAVNTNLYLSDHARTVRFEEKEDGTVDAYWKL